MCDGAQIGGTFINWSSRKSGMEGTWQEKREELAAMLKEVTCFGFS